MKCITINVFVIMAYKLDINRIFVDMNTDLKAMSSCLMQGEMLCCELENNIIH